MDIKTPSLPEPKFDRISNLENKSDKKSPEKEKKVKYLDQLYTKIFINKYFNEK